MLLLVLPLYTSKTDGSLKQHKIITPINEIHSLKNTQVVTPSKNIRHLFQLILQVYLLVSYYLTILTYIVSCGAVLLVPFTISPIFEKFLSRIITSSTK